MKSSLKPYSSSTSIVVPFLKWAGGKRWFLARHSSKLPATYETYIEPFLGSAAVYFYLKPQQAILSDTNVALMDTYRCIRSNWKRVFEILQWHQNKHCEKHYYDIRSKIYVDRYYRAAQFIYLNRTCWNGLYRVNLNGVFNVPIGTKSQVLLDTDCFEHIAMLLQRANLLNCDFEDTIDMAKENDLIFADPPYTALHKNNGFLKYNERIFSWDDQVRLYHALARAKDRGASIVVTNGDHKSIRDLFSPLGTVYLAERMSVLAGKPNARRNANEIIVCS